MDKISILVLVTASFVICTSKNENIIKSRSDALLDSLYTVGFDSKYKQDEVREIFREIESFGKIDNARKLLDFTISNKRYGYIAIGTIVKFMISEFPAFISFHGNELNVAFYDELCNVLNFSYYEKPDNQLYHSQILDVLIKIASENPNKDIKDRIFMLAEDISNFDQVKRIKELLDKKTKDGNRYRILVILSRFKNEVTDKAIIAEFEFSEYSEQIQFLAELGFKRFNRYDFLPYLYQIRKNLEKVSYFERTVETIDKVIPYLEQKKKENAPIGLPLDWGKPKGK